MSATTVDIYSDYSTGTPGSRGILVPIKASAVIKKGTLCIITAGYLDDGADAASSVFAGVATAGKTGGAADGDESVRVKRKGLFKFAMTGGSAAADLGKELEIKTNQEVGLAADTTNHVKCGRLIGWCDSAGNELAEWVSGAYCIVDITGY